MANNIFDSFKSTVSNMISWTGSKVKNIISTNVKKDSSKKILTFIADVVTNAVICVNETYVDSLKESGKFDKVAQATALKKARVMVVNQITDDARNYIINNYGNLETYINNKIEETVQLVKEAKKNK